MTTDIKRQTDDDVDAYIHTRLQEYTLPSANRQTGSTVQDGRHIPSHDTPSISSSSIPTFVYLASDLL